MLLAALWDVKKSPAIMLNRIAEVGFTDMVAGVRAANIEQMISIRSYDDF